MQSDDSGQRASCALPRRITDSHDGLHYSFAYLVPEYIHMQHDGLHYFFAYLVSEYIHMPGNHQFDFFDHAL